MTLQKFYICRHCGNIVEVVKASGVPMMCCGEPMQEIIAGSIDASREKHVPVVTIDGSKITVKVGSVDHPMIPEHYIEWISIQTVEGNQRKELTPGSKPEAVFALTESDKLVAAFAYCNLHGLWKVEL